MKLYVSASTWGPRKSANAVAGLCLVDFDDHRLLQDQNWHVLPTATRGFGGLTYDDQWLYAVRQVNCRHDELMILDRATLKPFRIIPLPDCYDVHQIDVFERLLWIANTNFHEIVVIEPRSGHIVGRRVVLPGVPEERALTHSNRKVEGDHRMRPHMNSLMVSKGIVQVGLFGTDSGGFHGSQLIELRWDRTADGGVHMHSPRALPVNGFRYPHNVHLRPDGAVLGCSSSEGEFRFGDRVLALGAWPRGVAITKNEIFVGLSSFSYGLSASEAHNRQPESNAAIVRIDRGSMKVTETFTFDRIGQVYEVRLAEGIDLGMSANLHQDLVSLRASRGAREAA